MLLFFINVYQRSVCAKAYPPEHLYDKPDDEIFQFYELGFY